MTRSEAITALYALFNAPHNADINLAGLNVLLDELYKSHPQEEPHMKSEQIKHSLSVGTKSIQSRVFDRETDEVISFVKIPIADSGLVRCDAKKQLTDEEILEVWKENEKVYPMDRSRLLDRTRACIRKAQIEVGCAECGVNGGHALYCVACAENYLKDKNI